MPFQNLQVPHVIPSRATFAALALDDLQRGRGIGSAAVMGMEIFAHEMRGSRFLGLAPKKCSKRIAAIRLSLGALMNGFPMAAEAKP